MSTIARTRASRSAAAWCRLRRPRLEGEEGIRSVVRVLTNCSCTERLARGDSNHGVSTTHLMLVTAAEAGLLAEPPVERDNKELRLKGFRRRVIVVGGACARGVFGDRGVWRVMGC